MADLYIAINRKTNTEAAVKKVCRRKLLESDVIALDDEIAVMRKLSGSKHVTQLLDVYEDVEYTHLVIERVYGTPLIEKLVAKKRYTEFDAKEVVRNLLLGVHHCHKNRIAIRNLKLESILLPDDDPSMVKISDFESAKVVTFPNSLRTQCGTQEYVAPEILTSHPAYDVSCDLWTVGVIVFIMLGGYYPFRAKKEEDVMKHGWFQTMKWQALFDREVKTPYIPEVEGPNDHSMFKEAEPKQDDAEQESILTDEQQRLFQSIDAVPLPQFTSTASTASTASTDSFGPAASTASAETATSYGGPCQTCDC